MSDEPLSEDRISAELANSPWDREGDAIVLDVTLDDFLAAVAAVQEVAALAQAHNHHPDILIHDYNELRLTLSTHSAGGLTAADFELAGQIAELSFVVDGG